MLQLEHVFIIYVLFLPGLLLFIALNYFMRLLCGFDLFAITSESFVNASWAVLMSIVFGFFLRAIAQRRTWLLEKCRYHKFMRDIFTNPDRSRRLKEHASTFSRNFGEEFESPFAHPHAFKEKESMTFRKCRQKIHSDLNQVYHFLDRRVDLQPIHDIRHSVFFIESLVVGLMIVCISFLMTAVVQALTICPPSGGCVPSFSDAYVQFFIIGLVSGLLSLPLRSHLKSLDRVYMDNLMSSFNHYIANRNES